METDNAEQCIITFEDGNVNLLNNHLSSAVDCSKKSSYPQHPPPVRFVDLGGQRSTQPVTSDQKNATMTSVPSSFLLNCPPGDQLVNPASVLDVEKEPIEIDDDYDDADDRPLVLDLKDTAGTSSPDAVVFSEEAPETFRRPLPPLKALPKVSAKALSIASPSTTVIINPTSTRVQKPIRPFIPQHFNSLDSNSGCHAPATMSASLAHQVAVPPPLGATTIRLQNISPQPHPPGPLSALSAPVGPHQTNSVQFMSILTPPPHSISSAVSPSPIHLFDLAPMPGYLTPSVFFQSIPSATVPTGGVQPAPPGSFPFAPPPPTLFAPHAFPPPLSHFARASSSLPIPNPHAHVAQGLPPPPPLAPAPGLTRTPLAGLFIPDMSAWMQPIPPLQPQPIFSAPPVPITTVAITSGEVLSMTNPAPLTTTYAITKSSSSAPKSLTPTSPTRCSLAVTTSFKSGNDQSPTSTTVNDVAITSTSNFSISARRWRPSFRRKNAANAATVNTPPLTSNIDKAPTTMPSTHATTLTTAMLTPLTVDTETSSATVEELPSQIRNLDSHENSSTKREKAGMTLVNDEAMDTALPKGVEAEKEKEEGEGQLSVLLPSSPPGFRLHSPKKTLQLSSPLSPASTTERRIISHFIDGHVLYESNIPFPVRNAMAIVRTVLKSNRSIKSCDVVPTQPVNKDATKTPMNDATTDFARMSTHWQHSVGLSLRGHRTRHLFKSNGSSSRQTDKHTEAKIGNEAWKKKRKKSSSTSHPPTRVGSIDTVTPMPALNGHEEVSTIVRGLTESQLAIPMPMKVATTAEPMLPRGDCAAVSSSGIIKTTATATTSIGGGGGHDDGGLGLSVKMQSCQSGGEAAPTATVSATSPSVIAFASTPPSSSFPSTTVASAVPRPCSASAASYVHLGTATTPTPTLATSIRGDGGSSFARSHRRSSLLSRELIKSWSPCAVANFVRGTPSCADYADAFVENEIDGEALLLLTPAHFIKPPICMKIGHALKFAHRIRQVLDPMPNPIDETDSGDIGTE